VNDDLDLENRIFSRDAWRFTALADSDVTLKAEKTSAQSARYILYTCISTTDRLSGCVHNRIRNNGEQQVTLHQAGTYYVVVAGLRLLKVDGKYRVRVTSDPGISSLELMLDNADDEPIEE
jgi:hypothetical protein